MAYPMERCSLSTVSRSFSFDSPVVLVEFRSIGFCVGRKTENPEEKLWEQARTNNKLNPLATLGLQATLVGGDVACVAGGIVGVRNNVLTAEPLKVSGEATRRLERRTLKYRLHENHGFLKRLHTSVQEKRIGREKYTRQSNVK